jgi:hypothetical protein
MSQDQVLLVEDDDSLIRAYRRQLMCLSLTAIAVVRLEESPDGPGQVLALASDGTQVDIDGLLPQLRFAMIDYQLVAGSLPGTRIVAKLKAAGVFCLGIGDRKDGQLALLEAGADLTVLEKILVSKALCGQLTVDDCRWPTQLAETTHREDVLRAFLTRLRRQT